MTALQARSQVKHYFSKSSHPTNSSNDSTHSYLACARRETSNRACHFVVMYSCASSVSIIVLASNTSLSPLYSYLHCHRPCFNIQIFFLHRGTVYIVCRPYQAHMHASIHHYSNFKIKLKAEYIYQFILCIAYAYKYRSNGRSNNHMCNVEERERDIMKENERQRLRRGSKKSPMRLIAVSEWCTPCTLW